MLTSRFPSGVGCPNSVNLDKQDNASRTCLLFATCSIQHLFFFSVDMVNDAVIPMAAVGIQYFSGPVVTILASKTSRMCTTPYCYLLFVHLARNIDTEDEKPLFLGYSAINLYYYLYYHYNMVMGSNLVQA